MGKGEGKVERVKLTSRFLSNVAAITENADGRRRAHFQTLLTHMENYRESWKILIWSRNQKASAETGEFKLVTMQGEEHNIVICAIYFKQAKPESHNNIISIKIKDILGNDVKFSKGSRSKE